MKKEEENIFSKYINIDENKKNEQNNIILNNLNNKFNDLILNQQQLNESIQKNFSQLLDKSNNNQDETIKPTVPLSNNNNNNNSNAYLMASQFQFQTQMQVQQLMFNLNAAYHEIATQRSEMSNLNEQMKIINSRLSELTSNKVTTGTNTTYDNEMKNQHHSSLMTTTNALPSYFYNRKHEQPFNRSSNETDCIKKQFKSYQISTNDQRTKQFSYSSKLEETSNNTKLLNQQSSINYYTDDFEDCDEDNEDEKNKQKNRSRSSSTASSTKTNRSVDTTSSTNISIRSKSSSSSNLALKQKITNNATPFWVEEKSNANECSSMTASQPQTIVHDGELFSFDRMREKIYSEVATLISQNEARPFFLLNLFRELQYLKDKNARDQALKSIFNINNRNQQFIKKDTEMTMRPKQKEQNVETNVIQNNEDDDFISYKYRMTKSEHIYKETDSCKQSNKVDIWVSFKHFENQ
jgi:pericentriolar material 1 protein